MSALFKTMTLCLILHAALPDPGKDIIMEGEKSITTEIMVSASRFADDWHFVYTSFDDEGRDLLPDQSLRGRYYFVIHAIPLTELDNLRKAQQSGREALEIFFTAKDIPSSAKIGRGGRTDQGDPATREVIRYEITKIEGGRVSFAEAEHLKFRSDGTVINASEEKAARKERSITLFVIAGLGLLGILAFAVSRRNPGTEDSL